MEDTDSNEWEMMVVAAQVATNTSQVAGSFLIFEEIGARMMKRTNAMSLKELMVTNATNEAKEPSSTTLKHTSVS
jgi:hypothetical protein